MRLMFTWDGVNYHQESDVIYISTSIGGYRKLGDQEFFYYKDEDPLSKEDKLVFESRMREIIRLAGKFEEEVNIEK